jgi:parallel beta-helix repeat protein
MPRRNKRLMILTTIIFFSFFNGAFYSVGIENRIDKYQTLELGNIYYVGGEGANNFTFIQDALDNATNGDSIFVYNGKYFENIKISKSIYLEGESKQKTIIDGQRKDSAIFIEEDKVTIKNLTITNATGKNLLESINTGGVKIDSSDSVKIINNIFKDNYNGIYGLRSTNLDIIGNEFINDGINFSPYNEGERPKIYKKYFQHKIENNTVNGKQLLYLKDKKDMVIDFDIGQLVMTNCSKILVQNISISDTDTPIHMSFCSYCNIENTKIYKTAGIWALRSDYNIFSNNTFSNNYLHGITLDYFSSYNTIEKNSISNNGNVGVMIEYYSKSNLIKNNNIFQNPYNSYVIQSFRNRWSFNYWDDWIGVKNKIIGQIFPKLILGIIIDKTRIPLFNFDWNPVNQEYQLD